VVTIFQELIGSLYWDSSGNTRSLSLADFLFVSPYNLQANRLRERLPDNARVGSVDKVQGQEAAVTVLSFGTSFGETGGRGLTFLLDQNRLNVAVSRAKCLVIVVGDPRIAHSEASSIEEMARINLYCRLVGYSTLGQLAPAPTT
jgi:superfamily I DNA and/or RNA helicase